MTRRLFATMLMSLLSLAAFSQQRDAPAGGALSPSGAGEITGVVISDDALPRPVRRAIVTLSGDLPAARSGITDDAGRFTFTRLPAGRFTVTARKAGYLQAAYGATRPGRTGTSIVLAADARIRVSLTMSKGGVVTGVIRDQLGVPLAGVPVAAVDPRGVTALENLLNSTETTIVTDDRGVYRVYGLLPGEYLVVATLPRLLGTGEIGQPSLAEMDALLGQLAQRSGGSSTTPALPFDPSRPSPVRPPPSVGYAPTFFPGTSVFTDAVRVKLTAGEERGGVDFAVGPVPVSRLSGGISGDAPNLAAVQLSILSGGLRVPLQLASSPILSERPDADGRFAFSNVAPGPYRITARVRRGQTEAATTTGRGSGGGAGGFSMTTTGTPGGTAGDYLYAVADVDVRGQDVSGLSLALRPGSVLSGRIVVDGTSIPAPTDFTKLLVAVGVPGGTFMSSSDGTIIGNSFSSVPPVAVRADGTFEIPSIGPGTYFLRCTLPGELAKSWWLRSATHAGRDLLDGPPEFAPGLDMTGVVLTLTDKHTELSGTLQTPAGTPAPDYFVVVFSTDRTFWRVGSRRLQSVRPGSDGRFLVRDLPAGDYLIAALTDVDPNEWQDPAFLDLVAPAGVKVTLGEGEKKTQDLRIR